MASVIFVNRFYAPDHSATAQILTDVAEYLASSGLDVAIVTSRAIYGDPESLLPRSETINGVRVHRVATPRGRNGIGGRLLAYLYFYLGAVAAIWRLAERGTVVVAKTDPPMIGVAAMPIVWMRGAVLMHWVQDLYPEVAWAMGMRFLRGPLGGLLAAARNWSFRRAAAVVAIGERMAEAIAGQGVARDKIHVIPNWTDDESITPSGLHAPALRAEWNIPDDAFVLEYSGNLGRAHEVATLLGAAILLRDHPDILFLFVGGGHHVDALRRDSEAAGLTSFRFAAYQPRERLSESLAVGNAHWLSLRPEFEGLIVPSKVFGICAAARPVIAVCDPDGEVPRMLLPHGACLTVAPGDTSALAEAILALHANRDLSRRMGASARTVLENSYRRKIACRRWRTLIDGQRSGEP